MDMKPVFAALTLCLMAVLPASAQPAEGRGPVTNSRGPLLRDRTPIIRGALPVDDSNAQDTQRRLQELLKQYPPSLRAVLALDPTLLTNEGYL